MSIAYEIAHDEQLHELQATMDDADGQITALTATLGILQTNLTNAQSDLVTAQAQLDADYTAFQAAIQTCLDAEQTPAEVVTNTMTDACACKTSRDQVSSLTQIIHNYQGDIANMQAKIASLTAQKDETLQLIIARVAVLMGLPPAINKSAPKPSAQLPPVGKNVPPQPPPGETAGPVKVARTARHGTVGIQARLSPGISMDI